MGQTYHIPVQAFLWHLWGLEQRYKWRSTYYFVSVHDFRALASLGLTAGASLPRPTSCPVSTWPVWSLVDQRKLERIPKVCFTHTLYVNLGPPRKKETSRQDLRCNKVINGILGRKKMGRNQERPELLDSSAGLTPSKEQREERSLGRSVLHSRAILCKARMRLLGGA